MSAEPHPDQGPFLEHIGPVLRREDGVLTLRIEERHLNAGGTAQGGLLATLVDFALGRAIEAGRDDGEAGAGNQATVSLTTDFLAAAKPGDVVEAHARVERIGGSLAFADCSLRVGDREIVRGRAVFAVLS
jgi:acyl-coenzyme A thioesterase PaaI-like protein